MNVPDNCRYAKTDEWARPEGELIALGISDYAQHELGEIVYVELPTVGDSVKSGVAFGVVESVKAVAELLSPLDGEVVEINDALPDDPSLINSSPFERGWMIRVRPSGDLSDELMDALAYASYRGIS